MNMKENKSLKYLIAGFVGFVFLAIISNTNKTYAAIPASQINLSLSQTIYTYDGKSHKPTVYANYHGGSLTKNTSYTVIYPKDTINSGKHTITVQFKGNYSGTKTIQYQIKGIPANKVNVFLNTYSFVYNGKQQTPTVRLYCRGNQLTKGTNYNISSYTGDCKSAGNHKINISLKGNYQGSIQVTYIIYKRNISGGSITLNQNSYTYTGNKIKPGIKSVKLNGTPIYDYTTSYGENIKAGKGWVKVTGKNNNTGSITKYFTINKRNISGGSIEFKRIFFVYNKTKIRPIQNDIEAVYMSDKKTKIYDYKIKSYGSNISGNGFITIEGINNNTGTITQSFKILKGKEAILEASKEIKKYISDNKYEYCIPNDYSECEHDSNNPRHGLNETFEESKTSYHNTCCATYVSWVLRYAGIINFTEHGAGNLGDYLESTKKFELKTSIEPGDILVYGREHIEIAANKGGSRVYNAGSKDAIRRYEKNVTPEGSTERGSSTPTRILRLK